MSLRQIELVKRWGVTRAAVSIMCKDGMPLDSVEAAEAWRRANRGWDGSIKISSLPCSKGAGGQSENGPEQTPPAVDGDAMKGDGMDGLLARAINEEREAYAAVYAARRAMRDADRLDVKGSFAFDFAQAFNAWREAGAGTKEEKERFFSELSQAFKAWAAADSDRRKAKGSFAYELSQALKVWRAAGDFRVQAERDHVEHLKRVGDLAPMAAALELIERTHRPVRKLLRGLPSAMRLRCNPGAPDVAEQALKEWADQAFDTVAKEVRRA